MKSFHTFLLAGVAAALGLAVPAASAVDRTYTDGAGNNLWSAGDNWSPTGMPVAADTAIFTDTGGDAGTAVTSILDLPGLNLTGLDFQNGNGGNQHLDLNANTLTVDDYLYVGRNVFGQTNQTRITGGALALGSIGTPVADVQIGYRSAAGNFVTASLAATLSDLTAYVTRFDIGRAVGDNQQGVDGRLDLTAGGNVFVEAGRVYLGTMTGVNITNGAKGTLALPVAATSTLRSAEIWLGDSPGGFNTSVTSLMDLGRETVIQADAFDVGRRKALGTVKFGTGVTGGVVTIAGLTGSNANVKLGWNNAGTGAGSIGLLDTRGGTLNASLDEVILGLHGSGTGSGQGSLYMDTGTVTINTLRMALTDTAGSSTADGNTLGAFGVNGGTVAVSGNVEDGNGVSLVYADGGTMQVGGSFAADDLRIGYNGKKATLTVAGPVRIGNGTNAVEIGYRTLNQNVLSEGTANFTNAPSVTINSFALRLGFCTAGSASNTTGWLRLPAAGSNSVSLSLLSIGDSSAAGNTADTSEINLGGGTTTLGIDEINVGHRKSKGVLRAENGAAVAIGGRTTTEADLYVGRNNVDTGTNSEGLMALTNGSLAAVFDQVVLGLHNSGSGSGKGTFIVGPGTVTANDILLGRTSAAGTSSVPQNTHGRLLIRDGSVTVAGDVRDSGGLSVVELTSGRLDVGYDLVADAVTIGQAGGSNATLVLNGRAAGQAWQIGGYTQNVTGVLEVNLCGTDPVIQTTNATFASGSTLRLGVTGGGDAFTNAADTTAWTGGTGVWDDTSDLPWSSGNPASRVVIASNDVIPILTTSGTLTDNGLALEGTDWLLTVFPGAAGSIIAQRNAADITTGQRPALIADAVAVVGRTGDLLIGDATGSGANAASLTMSAGTLAVDGNMTGDSGRSTVWIDGGLLAVDGGIDVDNARFGYSGGTASAVFSNGAVRIGDPFSPELQDVARRESATTNHTIATVDLSQAESVEVIASSLRIGTANANNGGVVRGVLTLSSAGTNTLTAGALVVGDSPQEGNGDRNNNGPTNTLHFGALANVVAADEVYIGRRKIVARADIAAGGTLVLAGKTTGAVLRVGYNDAGTGTITEGVLDLSGGSLQANLASMQVGRHDNGGGAGRGLFIMDAGSLVVSNDVELARVSVGGASTSPQATTGSVTMSGGTVTIGGNLTDGGGTSAATFDGADVIVTDIRNLDVLALTGGSLTANVITNATGATAFTFSNARLSVAVISIRTNLVQVGGVLAPGAPVGLTRIDGDYAVTNGGTWELEVDGYASDRVAVAGTLDLADAVLDLTETNHPALAETYILATYGGLTGTFGVTNVPAGWTLDYDYLGGSQIALVQVPGLVTNFTVEISNGVAVVRWNTTNETNVAGFHVERANESNQWVRLTGAMIPAIGVPSSYAYTDTTAILGRQYSYRVIIVDGGAGETPAGPYVRSITQELRFGAASVAAPGVVNVTWRSNTGEQYSIERALSLDVPDWTPVASNLLATPPQNAYGDSNAPSPKAYYRVQIEP